MYYNKSIYKCNIFGFITLELAWILWGDEDSTMSVLVWNPYRKVLAILESFDFYSDVIEGKKNMIQHCMYFSNSCLWRHSVVSGARDVTSLSSTRPRQVATKVRPILARGDGHTTFNLIDFTITHLGRGHFLFTQS